MDRSEAPCSTSSIWGEGGAAERGQGELRLLLRSVRSMIELRQQAKQQAAASSVTMVAASALAQQDSSDQEAHLEALMAQFSAAKQGLRTAFQEMAALEAGSCSNGGAEAMEVEGASRMHVSCMQM
jgi:hypothetical protein